MLEIIFVYQIKDHVQRLMVLGIKLKLKRNNAMVIMERRLLSNVTIKNLQNNNL